MQNIQIDEITADQLLNSYNLIYCDLDIGKFKTVYVEAASIADAERKFLEKHWQRKSRMVVWKIILLDLADGMRNQEFKKYRKRRSDPNRAVLRYN